MKIETPEDFVEKLPWMSINGKPDLIQWGNHVRFRDAAIRAESAALLKMCREALRWIVDSDYMYDIHETARAALDALGETGVKV